MEFSDEINTSVFSSEMLVSTCKSIRCYDRKAKVDNVQNSRPLQKTTYVSFEGIQNYALQNTNDVEVTWSTDTK